MRQQQFIGFEGEDIDIMLGVNADEFGSGKCQKPRRCFPREVERHTHPSLSKNVYLTISVLRIAGTDSQERLNRIVCDRADLRIYTISSQLQKDND